MVGFTVNSPTTTVPYHQQDTNHWCGSACVLMVLHSLGMASAGGFPLDQKRVRMIAHNSAKSDPTYQWASAPDGLTAALNYLCHRSDVPLPEKEGAARRWELVAAGSEEEISRYIVWSLWHYRTPAIALVFGMQHWVVVGGCVTSRPPRSAEDTGYDIVGFHLCDPWPPIPRELARNDRFRHLDLRDASGSVVVTDGCGSGWEGDPDSDTLGGRGVALRYVSYNDWQIRDHSTPDRKRHTGYMTGVPPTLKLTTRPGKPEIPVRSRWVGQFLAICDPVATGTSMQVVERALRGLSLGRQGGVEELQSPEKSAYLPLRLISPDEAIQVASEALDTQYAIATVVTEEGDRLTDKLTKVSRHEALQLSGLPSHSPIAATGPGEPVLVEWLDEPGAYQIEAAYYIVPFHSEGVQHAAVRVAARIPSGLNSGEMETRERGRLFLGINLLFQPSPTQASHGESRQASAIMSEQKARSLIIGRSFRGKQGGRILVPKDYNEKGRPTWKPCLQSFDPCCPFYEFRIPPQAKHDQPAYLYVRTSDGEVFSQLTEYLGGA